MTMETLSQERHGGGAYAVRVDTTDSDELQLVATLSGIGSPERNSLTLNARAEGRLLEILLSCRGGAWSG